MITEHSQPSRAPRCADGWSDRLSREAAACKGLRRTLFGRLRGRRTREWSWQPGGRSRHTLFRYDELNRVTELADARQGITRFSYDPNGNLLTVTDAKGQTTTYTYDQMDRQAPLCQHT